MSPILLLSLVTLATCLPLPQSDTVTVLPVFTFTFSTPTPSNDTNATATATPLDGTTTVANDSTVPVSTVQGQATTMAVDPAHPAVVLLNDLASTANVLLAQGTTTMASSPSEQTTNSGQTSTPTALLLQDASADSGTTTLEPFSTSQDTIIVSAGGTSTTAPVILQDPSATSTAGPIVQGTTIVDLSATVAASVPPVIVRDAPGTVMDTNVTTSETSTTAAPVPPVISSNGSPLIANASVTAVQIDTTASSTVSSVVLDAVRDAPVNSSPVSTTSPSSQGTSVNVSPEALPLVSAAPTTPLNTDSTTVQPSTSTVEQLASVVNVSPVLADPAQNQQQPALFDPTVTTTAPVQNPSSLPPQPLDDTTAAPISQPIPPQQDQAQPQLNFVDYQAEQASYNTAYQYLNLTESMSQNLIVNISLPTSPESLLSRLGQTASQMNYEGKLDVAMQLTALAHTLMSSVDSDLMQKGRN